MARISSQILSAFAAVLFGTAPSVASTIETVDFVLSYVSFGAGDTVNDTTEPRATVQEEREYTSSGNTLQGTAIQDASGFSLVEVVVNPDGSLIADGTDTYFGEAVAIRQVTVTNDTEIFQQGYFDFRISGVILELANYNTLSPDPTATISFEAFAVPTPSSLDTIDSFLAQTTLTGIAGGPFIKDEEMFSGTLELLMSGFEARYTVEPLVGQLDLGLLAPGESVTIKTVLTAQVLYDGRESGASARGVDPNQVSMTDYSVRLVPAAVVPLPAAAWLSLAGIAALGFAARKRGA